jgi:unsaturated rhamnogalacturonyl hydrolase
MWLDGSYMALPFLARIAVDSHEPQSTFNDIAHQFELFDEHTYDIKSGLNYHGWDSARKQSWANPDTGTSSNFWGRAEGWYAMALVDTLDYFPKNNTNRASLVKLLQKTCNGIIRHQDAESGLWWQVMDKPVEQGNYKEATASAMFVYTLAKGYNLNYLNTPEFKIAALKGYQGIIHQLVKEEPKGKWNLTQCCQVAGLSTTNAAGHSRDGSFAYYISEPVVENDLKGLGPLILAGIEIQNIVDGKKQLHIDLNK